MFAIMLQGQLNKTTSAIQCEPGQEKMCLMYYANICEEQGTDQPAHPRGLISIFISRCLDSIISLDSIVEISRL